jgi:SAM-dependent methyltransferase
MKSYAELFDLRGSSYDQAMLAFPDARSGEFSQIIAALDPQPGDKIGDIPAGGGYLRDHLPEGCIWLGHEPCASFTNHGNIAPSPSSVPLLPLPWPDGHLDGVCSLAGVHHLEDKTELFSEVRRVMRPGARFALSDVAEGSAVAQFLDGFVGKWNSTGHEGVYLNQATLAELGEAGLRVEHCDTSDFLWRFPDRDSMAAFCTKLFDISGAAQSHVAEAIEQVLGTQQLSDGGIGMNWSLMTVLSVSEQ